MRIAFLSEKYTPDIGGLAISADRLARLLAGAGHCVHVFAPTVSLLPSDARTLESNGVTVTRFGVRKRIDDMLVEWSELVAAAHAAEPYDVLHAYFLAQAGFVAAQAARELGVPCVVSARGNDLERAVFDPGRAAHILFALQSADAVTTNAASLARRATALVPGLRVTVIPNGVDTSHFRPLPRNRALARSLSVMSEQDASSPGCVIGFAGELREKKGLRPLLGACAQVSRARPATLLIVGDVRAGEDRLLVDEFRRAHPDLQIAITGFVPPRDLPAYYSLMDIFVQPSLRDGLPNALLEAMACERPVVASAAGGIPDVVTDRHNGLLVPPRDESALAQAILGLLADESLARELGRAGRETVREKFTPDAELEGNLGVYRHLGLNA